MLPKQESLSADCHNKGAKRCGSRFRLPPYCRGPHVRHSAAAEKDQADEHDSNVVQEVASRCCPCRSVNVLAPSRKCNKPAWKNRKKLHLHHSVCFALDTTFVANASHSGRWHVWELNAAVSTLPVSRKPALVLLVGSHSNAFPPNPTECVRQGVTPLTSLSWSWLVTSFKGSSGGNHALS